MPSFDSHCIVLGQVITRIVEEKEALFDALLFEYAFRRMLFLFDRQKRKANSKLNKHLWFDCIYQLDLAFKKNWILHFNVFLGGLLRIKRNSKACKENLTSVTLVDTFAHMSD